MRIKLDEGLSVKLKPTLRDLGHDVDTVLDEGLKSEADAVLAEEARLDRRMLFTLDKGLGDVRQYTPGAHPGIVVFRMRHTGPGTMNRLIEQFVATRGLEGLGGCVAIVEPGNVRIRRPDEDDTREFPR